MSDEVLRPETIEATQTTCGEFRDLVKALTDNLPLYADGESRMLKLPGFLISQAPSIEYEGGTDYSAMQSTYTSPMEGIRYAIDTYYTITEEKDGTFRPEREVHAEDVSTREVVSPSVEDEARQMLEGEARKAAMSEEEREKNADFVADALRKFVGQAQEERDLGLRTVTEQELQQVIKSIKALSEDTET